MSAYVDNPAVRDLDGASRVRGLVADRTRGVPQGELERELDRLYRRYRLPVGLRQVELTTQGGRLVRFDRAHTDERVGVEVDGRATHTGRLDWQSDLERGNETGMSNWLVLRFTWWHVTERPDYVAFTIARALDLLPTGWRHAVGSATPARWRARRAR